MTSPLSSLLRFLLLFWLLFAAGAFPSITWGYDAQIRHLNIGYDQCSLSATEYDYAAALIGDREVNSTARTAGANGLFDKCTDSLAAKNAPVIIGENMNRVNAYTGRVGGETIDGWLAGRKWTQQMNDEFIATMKAQGRQFQDIGPDFGRRLQNRIDPNFGRPPGSVYGGERQSLLDYGNYQRLYDRTGKYQGGVPGLDP